MDRIFRVVTFIILVGAVAVAQGPPGAHQQPSSSSGAPKESEAPPSEPYKVNLRCEGLQTAQQARAVKSDSLGFGNPTSPDSNGVSKPAVQVSRTALVEINGKEGRINLPPQFSASSDPAHSDGWWSISNVRVTAGDVYFEFTAHSPGPQVVRLNRISGQAELRGYGPKALHAACHIDRIKTQF